MTLLKANNVLELADRAAKLTLKTLSSAIDNYGEASWVLAGGSSPSQAYKMIVDNYAKTIDWRRVWFSLGDERHVIGQDPESNWGQIERSLLSSLAIDDRHKIAPVYNPDVSTMAETYNSALLKLPKQLNGLPRFDLIWLGLGEDGHTLSLFPGRQLDTASLSLVTAVTDSPKLPSNRISLTLTALKQAKGCLILASGETKARAVAGLINQDKSLPITQAVKTIEDSGSKVTLLIDSAAGSLITSV